MQSAAPDGHPPSPLDDELFVIGSEAQAFGSRAALAPGLSEAELRVCLYLASIQDPDQHTARAGSTCNPRSGVIPTPPVRTKALLELRGYPYKWLTLQRGQQHAQPPDTTLCAQLATADGAAWLSCTVT